MFLVDATQRRAPDPACTGIDHGLVRARLSTLGVTRPVSRVVVVILCCRVPAMPPRSSQALLGQGRGGVAVVLVNVDGLPRIADPLVADGAGRQVPAVGDIVGECALLGLVLVLHGIGESARVWFGRDGGHGDARGAQRWQTRS